MKNELRKRKGNFFVAILFLPLVAPSVLIAWALGYLWGFIYGGFREGEDYAAKLGNYETNEEIINRVIKENGGSK